MVCIWTSPPANSPGRSGVYVLRILMFSMRPEGKRSSETTRFSGSVVGRTAPFIMVEE